MRRLHYKYRGEKKGLQILAGPGRKAKQGQEERSRNHVPTFFLGSVVYKEERKLRNMFAAKLHRDCTASKDRVALYLYGRQRTFT